MVQSLISSTPVEPFLLFPEKAAAQLNATVSRSNPLWPFKNSSTSSSFKGSSFDSLLEQEGIREEVEAVAIKRVLAWQLEQAMRKQQKTKQARQLHTSRSQLDRLLDSSNVSVTLDTITRAARFLASA